MYGKHGLSSMFLDQLAYTLHHPCTGGQESTSQGTEAGYQLAGAPVMPPWPLRARTLPLLYRSRVGAGIWTRPSGAEQDTAPRTRERESASGPPARGRSRPRHGEDSGFTGPCPQRGLRSQ